MLGAVVLVQLTLWITIVSAFYPWCPPYRCCADEKTCTDLQKRDAGEDVAARQAPAARGVTSFSLVKARAVIPGGEPAARVARLADRVKRKYGLKASTTVQPAHELAKRTNAYSIVTAAVPTQTNSLGIDQDGTDFSYFIQSYFGSKQTPLYMLLDTGAGTTWVMGTNCQSAACTMHNTFGPSDSTSYQTSAKSFSIAYGSGSVGGQLASDVIGVGNLKPTMSFGVANQTSDDFKYFPFDGILGLSMSTGATDNFVQVVKTDKLLPANVYAVSINRDGDGPDTGEITFGGTDSAKYTGQIVYTPVSSAGGGDWAIALGGLSYNSKDAGVTGRVAYIDTGTSYCFGPASDVAALHKLIPGATTTDNVTYTVPCANAQPISMAFSGATYTISSDDWLSSPSSSGTCTSNIYGHEVVTGAWLLGDVFLKNVYAVFDADKSQIGLANKPSVPTPSSNSSSLSATGTITSVESGTMSTRPGLSGHETSATAASQTSPPSPSNTVSPGEQLESNVYVSFVCIVAVVALIA